MPREDGSYAPEELEQIKAGLAAEAEVARRTSDEAIRTRDQTIAGLQASLQSAQGELAGVKAAIESSRAELRTTMEATETLNKALADAAARHRALMLQANPDIPEELVAGEDIPGLEASMQKARAVVDKVKARLAADSQQLAANHHVPPGAPPRSAPDVESLSPTEKIKHALRGR